MIFYEDFIKKINNNMTLSGKENFRLELKKSFLWLGTGIPFLIVGVIQFLIGYKTHSNMEYFIGIIFLILSFKHIKLWMNYKIILDFDKDLLISRDIKNISLTEIESCTLKEDILNKRNIQKIIRIVTINKEEIVIPLYMNNKLKFVSFLKTRLKDKFVIIK